jgi:hypothetical protein
MGFVDRQFSHAVSHLSAGDYLTLALLGSLARCRRLELEDLFAAATALGAPYWLPTSQLIDEALSSLRQAELIRHLANERALSITETGLDTLTCLLCRPVTRPLSAFGQAGMQLKLAFLDLLPPPWQHRQLDQLITAYECEIRQRNTSPSIWKLNGPFGQAWSDQNLDGMEESLGVLRRMARLEPADSAESRNRPRQVGTVMQDGD